MEIKTLYFLYIAGDIDTEFGFDVEFLLLLVY